jgi:hypothetical protein
MQIATRFSQANTLKAVGATASAINPRPRWPWHDGSGTARPLATGTACAPPWQTGPTSCMRSSALQRAHAGREFSSGGAVSGGVSAQACKAYVALNVLIFAEELEDAVAELRLLNDSCRCGHRSDGLAEISRRTFPALRVHPTQMTITSPEGAFREGTRRKAGRPCPGALAARIGEI